MTKTLTESEQIEKFMQTREIARAKDLREFGISGTAISRARDEGILIRLSRGLYTTPDTNMDTHFQLAEIAKRYPDSVISLVSALAFYGVTDQLPTQIWMAIKKDGRKPKSGFPRIRPVRFREPYYSGDIIHHSISGVDVPMYKLEKTLADAFRNPKLVDRSVAIEALKTTLAEKKSTPAKIAVAAKTYAAWNQMAPYLEALTANG
ncbi:MAG: type IV toxin-antitoxin system AbiEi family antitoxin domain-containing protein [Maricaulaceae bacterium]